MKFRAIFQILGFPVFLMFLSTFPALFSPSFSLALTADEIIEKVDENMRSGKDNVGVSKMTLVEKDGTKREREVKMYFRNNPEADDYTLTRFLSPADVKGVSFLSLSEDQMYLYMPAFRKIRRIASHVKHENFMGTDFSYDDMGNTEYKEDYDAKLLEETQTEYVLEATPKPEADVGYSKVKVWVNKENFIPNKIEFYHQKKGTLLKILTNSQIEEIQGHWTPRKMVMENVEDKHQTIIDVTEIKYDVGLADDIFTQRNLKKPE